MGLILKNGQVVKLDPLSIERLDVEINNGRIAAYAPELTPTPADSVIDLQGQWLLPGLVCAHTHLYSALARGMPAPQYIPTNFHEILKYVWWRLDQALDEETIYYSALAGGIAAIRAGTTTLIDHHASPGYINNSLAIVRQALSDLGLRAVLCYEATDRGGEAKYQLGLAENRRALAESSGLYRALVGAHAAFTLSDNSLKLLAELSREFDCGIHIHVAEDRLDLQNAQERHWPSLIDRLSHQGILRPGSILAHCTHLDQPALQKVIDSGGWLIHNPRSNMNNGVGYAPLQHFGNQAALGTDGIGADMLAEAQLAFYKSQDAHTGLLPSGAVKLLANGQKLVSTIFGEDLSGLSVGAPADLTILDYQPPTPATPDNLSGHFIFGLSAADVHSVMVAGRWLLRDRVVQTLNSSEAMIKAQSAATKLWERMAKVPYNSEG